MRRSLALLIAAVLVAACDKPEAPAKTENGTATVPGYIASRGNILPDWLQIARTREGGFVQYNAKTVSKDAAAGTTDIWLQFLYLQPQTYVAEDATATRQIQYTKERYLYRFRCATKTFTMAEHQIIGAGDKVVESVKTPPTGEADWRSIQQGGPASMAYGPACKAA